MKTKFFLSLLLFQFTLNMQAQKKELKFQSVIQVGLLEGEQGSALQLQTIQGLKCKTWSAGVGVGLDYYHTRTIPLFLDVRKALGRKENTVFVYVGGGYNFPWLKEVDKIGFENDSKGGLYYDAGIGYQLPVFKTQQLFFSAGFSQKNFSKTYNSMPYLSIWPPPPQAYQQYKYLVRRLSIKAGLRF